MATGRCSGVFHGGKRQRLSCTHGQCEVSMVSIIPTMKAMAMRRFNFTIRGFIQEANRLEASVQAQIIGVAIPFLKAALVTAIALIALFLFNANPQVVAFSDFLHFVQSPAFLLYTCLGGVFLPLGRRALTAKV